MLLLAEFTGWGPQEILAMTIDDFLAWLQALDEIYGSRNEADAAKAG